MTTWYRTNLGDAMLANEALSVIQTHLTSVYHKANEPESLLAVYRHESQGLHCRVIVYLTAEFQYLARLENAYCCHKPPLSDAGFLAGNETHFNEN